MIGFLLFLMAVFIGGTIVLALQGVTRKRTLPLPTEFTAQLVGESAAEQVKRQALPTFKAAKAPNSHWAYHTFNKPRRKVKK